MQHNSACPQHSISPGINSKASQKHKNNSNSKASKITLKQENINI